MCGIIGGNFFSSKKEVKYYLQKIKHRGKDNSSLCELNNFYLGHNRLAIQDLSDKANQPMFSEDKKVVIVYNGELWNSSFTKELKNKIGIQFKTHSDTEIILLGYIKFGEEVFKELDGMFSLSILDLNKNKCFLVRDFVGELPFWYFIENKKLAFASEKKALPLYKIYEKQLKTILPGSYIIYDLITGSIEEKKYYTLPTEIINKEEKELIFNIRYLLEESVKVKLISDVPVCSILSGGIDSTIITYLVKKYKQDIESFVVSLGEGNSQSDDIKFARIAAKEFGIKLHELILTEKEVLSKLKEVVYVVEQSRWQNIGSAIVQIFLGKLINQKGFKVVFSGDLSDEIFGSYGHIQRYYYKPDDYDKIRRKLVEKVHETNFITSNQAFMWGGTIETRTPYSWRPFVEYSLNVPTKYRLINGHMKYLLRKAFEGEISANLLWRRKVPFTEGARTANLIETKKELLKTYLKDIFKYKDNKYTQEVLF